MTPLRYDSRDAAYHGVQSDGTPVCIDGDAYAEALQRRERDGDSHELAERATSDPDGWSEDMEGWIPAQPFSSRPRGGRAPLPEAQRKLQRTVMLAPETFAALAAHARPGEPLGQTIDRVVREICP